MTPNDAASTATKPPLYLGPVFRETAGVFLARFPLFFLFAAYIWVPDLIMEYVLGLSPTTGMGPMFFIYTITNIAVIQAYSLIHEGSPVPALRLPNIKGKQLFAAFIVYILVSLMIGIGLVLLVVPGLFAIAVYSFVLPVCVTERTGVSESFKRASELSLGYRWKILAGFLIVGLSTVGLVTAIPFALIFGLPEDSTLLQDPAATAIGIAITVFAAIVNIFMSLFGVVLYRHVLTAKEGGRQAEIAAVFD